MNKKPLLPLNDGGYVGQFACDEVAAITSFGTLSEVILTTKQTNIYDRTVERMVVVRLLIPTDQLAAIGCAFQTGSKTVQRCEEDQPSVSLN